MGVQYQIEFTRGDQIAIDENSNVYAPVISWSGIRYFLTLTVLLGLRPLQLDFDLAYLNADLEEVIHMRPPPGYELDDGKLNVSNVLVLLRLRSIVSVLKWCLLFVSHIYLCVHNLSP
jgi:hypothetical protein